MGYDDWRRANETARDNSSDIMDITDSITEPEDRSKYVSATESGRTVSKNGPVVNFPFPHSKHHTVTRGKLRRFSPQQQYYAQPLELQAPQL